MLWIVVENINFLSIWNFSSCFMFDLWIIENGFYMGFLKILDYWILLFNFLGLGFECCYVSL